MISSSIPNVSVEQGQTPVQNPGAQSFIEKTIASQTKIVQKVLTTLEEAQKQESCPRKFIDRNVTSTTPVSWSCWIARLTSPIDKIDFVNISLIKEHMDAMFVRNIPNIQGELSHFLKELDRKEEENQVILRLATRGTVAIGFSPLLLIFSPPEGYLGFYAVPFSLYFASMISASMLNFYLSPLIDSARKKVRKIDFCFLQNTERSEEDKKHLFNIRKYFIGQISSMEYDKELPVQHFLGRLEGVPTASIHPVTGQNYWTVQPMLNTSVIGQYIVPQPSADVSGRLEIEDLDRPGVFGGNAVEDDVLFAQRLDVLKRKRELAAKKSASEGVNHCTQKMEDQDLAPVDTGEKILPVESSPGCSSAHTNEPCHIERNIETARELFVTAAEGDQKPAKVNVKLCDASFEQNPYMLPKPPAPHSRNPFRFSLRDAKRMEYEKET